MTKCVTSGVAQAPPALVLARPCVPCGASHGAQDAGWCAKADTLHVFVCLVIERGPVRIKMNQHDVVAHMRAHWLVASLDVGVKDPLFTRHAAGT